MTFTLHNRDLYSDIEVGALGMPLCFQVRLVASSMQHVSHRTMHCCIGHAPACKPSVQGTPAVLGLTSGLQRLTSQHGSPRYHLQAESEPES